MVAFAKKLTLAHHSPAFVQVKSKKLFEILFFEVSNSFPNELESHYGIFCEKPFDICFDNKCMNGGECYHVTNYQYGCKCIPPYSGVFCENQIETVCHSNPCLNNGTCHLKTNQKSNQQEYICSCQS
jgi:hypothetical protein